MPEEIEGVVERVTYHNEENGFCVARVRPKGTGSIVTVVGTIPFVHEGERLRATGEWQNDRTYGRQFRAETVTQLPMAGRVQIEAFLGSGAIRGVGPSTALLLYQKFGDKVFEILEEQPQRLREVSGIGKKRAEMIAASWQAQKGIRDLMIFLAESGIGLGRATRIHKHFGGDAIRVIKTNPYRLEEIRGIGFSTADAVALKLGMPRDSIERARAGISHALREATTSGHTGLPADDLREFAARLLGIPAERVAEAIALEVEGRRLVRDTIADREAIFLPRYFQAERSIARDLRRLQTSALPWPAIDASKAITWLEKKSSFRLSSSQREAVELVLKSKVSVITGGPGVGKTTLVNSILKIVRAKDADVLLCAPTGRAAKRLSETTGLEAKTIHRLLEVNAETGVFGRDSSNPLECDLVVVDESSMIDVLLMEALLRAIPASAALLVVGDVDQLSAVGAGQVLADIIGSGTVPVIRLTEIFRQAAESKIVLAAHAINEGHLPDLSNEGATDFFFMNLSPIESAMEKIINMVTNRIPKKFGLDPLREVQVLAPMHKGSLGVQSLNDALQAALNKQCQVADAPRMQRMGTSIYIGDKVMQTVNNYEKDVFNGDIGVVESIDSEEDLLMVDFDGRSVEYIADELDDLVLAYAATIHKSQGSEYPAVVLVLARQHSIMLQRNLLYTAVTRGKRLVVVAAEREAVGQSVRTRESSKRWSKLKEWMRSAN